MKSLRRLALPVLLASSVLVLAVSTAQEDAGSEREALEEAFAELLTGAQLTGWFTDDTRPDAPHRDVTFRTAKDPP